MSIPVVSWRMLTWIHWMKVISLKPQKPQPLPPAAEEKLNKEFISKDRRKAVVKTCLFLFLLSSSSLHAQQQWVFDETSRKAYDLVLNLQLEEAMQLLQSGRYSVTADKVTHHVEVASYQNWVNTDLVRTFTLTSNRLTLRTPQLSVGGTMQVWELVFERVP